MWDVPQGFLEYSFRFPMEPREAAREVYYWLSIFIPNSFCVILLLKPVSLSFLHMGRGFCPFLLNTFSTARFPAFRKYDMLAGISWDCTTYTTALLTLRLAAFWHVSRASCYEVWMCPRTSKSHLLASVSVGDEQWQSYLSTLTLHWESTINQMPANNGSWLWGE